MKSKNMSIDEACDELLLKPGSRNSYKRIKKAIENGIITRYSKYRSYIFDAEHILELRERVLNHEIKI